MSESPSRARETKQKAVIKCTKTMWSAAVRNS